MSDVSPMGLLRAAVADNRQAEIALLELGQQIEDLERRGATLQAQLDETQCIAERASEDCDLFKARVADLEREIKQWREEWNATLDREDRWTKRAEAAESALAAARAVLREIAVGKTHEDRGSDSLCAARLCQIARAALASGAEQPAKPKPTQPLCFACGCALQRVVQSENSMLNRWQWEASIAGNWVCERCPKPNGRGQDPANSYWWDREIEAGAPQPAEKGEWQDANDRNTWRCNGPCCAQRPERASEPEPHRFRCGPCLICGRRLDAEVHVTVRPPFSIDPNEAEPPTERVCAECGLRALRSGPDPFGYRCPGCGNYTPPAEPTREAGSRVDSNQACRACSCWNIPVRECICPCHWPAPPADVAAGDGDAEPDDDEPKPEAWTPCPTCKGSGVRQQPPHPPSPLCTTCLRRLHGGCALPDTTSCKDYLPTGGTTR
jgi:hypothetical protein